VTTTAPQSAEHLHVTGARRGDELIVTLAGDIDAACRERISEFVQLEVDACPGVLVLDMAAVTFVDSSGLAMLVKAHRGVTANGGTVIVRSPSEQFCRLLEITGLDQYVTVEQPWSASGPHTS
jgi:anti-sigma B factor antagonist